MPQARDEAGNIWEVDEQGNPVRLLQPAQGTQPVTIGNRNPVKVAKDTADLQGTQAGTQGKEIDNRLNAITLADQARTIKANADAAEASARAKLAELEKVGSGRPQLTAAEFGNAIQGYNSAEALTKIIADLEAKYAAGPGATKGIAGVRDWFNTPGNQAFDQAANAARGTVGQALGFTGGQLNSATEAAMNVGPYIPKASDWDSSILATIQRLKDLQQQSRDRSIAILGGIPDANGKITPLDDRKGTVWQQTNIINGGGPGAAPSGSTTQQQAVPPEMQAELNAYIQQNAGNLDPNALQGYIGQLYQKYGYSADPALAADYAGQAAGAARNGGTINTQIPGATVPLSGIEKLRNDAVSNPFGAAAVGALDMGGFGGVSALAPQDMAALRDSQGLPMMLGEIGGAIAGTEGLGYIGRNTLGRALPSLMGGGTRGALARGVGTDALYSGITGSNQGGDPLGSAAVGAGASVLGRGVGNVAGRAIGGLELPQAVQILRDRGMNRFTTGQQLGGVGKGSEDAMTSILGVGDLVNARRMEGLTDFNRAAFNDPALTRVGAGVNTIGEQGAKDAIARVGTAYDNATAGLSTPFDPQFATDYAAARAAGQRLPPDLQQRFNLALDNRVEPLVSGGVLTGEGYQQAFRGLKGYRAENVKPGFESDYRDALTQAMEALTGQAQRGGGDSVVTGLRNADNAYRHAKTLQKAVQAARNGGRTGEVQVFAPSQLVDAGWASATKYGGDRPFAELADAGQQVLPSKLPDSGTAKRLATQMAATAGLAGGGAGLDYYSGDGMDNTMKGLALAAALGLGGTKVGQKVINDTLFVRPEAIRRAGQSVLNKRGLFGHGAIPLLLPVAQ